MWESDAWDHGYTRISGPVEMDSTGTSIAKIGSKRYAMFGSADRKVYVRTYPGLEPAGELNLHLPPWNDRSRHPDLAECHPPARKDIPRLTSR